MVEEQDDGWGDFWGVPNYGQKTMYIFYHRYSIDGIDEQYRKEEFKADLEDGGMGSWNEEIKDGDREAALRGLAHKIFNCPRLNNRKDMTEVIRINPSPHFISDIRPGDNKMATRVKALSGAEEDIFWDEVFKIVEE